jgi:hypothetical protein
MNSPRVCSRPAALADVGDAPVHQLEVGGAGREARMRGGVLALDLARQLGQPVQQQRLLVCGRRCADRLGQFGQFALGPAQRGERLARAPAARAAPPSGRCRSPAAAAPGGRAGAGCIRARQQHHAREAVGMQREVGVDLAMAVGDGGGDQRSPRAAPGATSEPSPFVRAGQHPQVQRRQPLARQGASQSCGTACSARWAALLAERGGIEGREKVQLTNSVCSSQRTRKCRRRAAGAWCRRRASAGGGRAAARQVRRGWPRAPARRHHHDVRQRQRRAHRLGRPGVDLVVQRDPLGVRGG